MTGPINQSSAPIKVNVDTLAEYGERPLPFAPQVSAMGKVLAVPQQFLLVSRSLTQLEAILERIETIDGYLLFAGVLENTLYLQIGIIGHENYPSGKGLEAAQGAKVVYGRRWLIEDSTPTSEVVQTALLALQKAREHELREKLSIELNEAGHRATPFNSHQDAPLMAQLESTITCPSQDTIEQAISKVTFEGRDLNLVCVETIGATIEVVRLRLEPNANTSRFLGFPELDDHDIIVCFNHTHANALLHELAEKLISLSNRFVAENFSFDGFKRFCHRINPVAVAKFSYDSRRPLSVSQSFAPYLNSMSYKVDSRKAPAFNAGKLGQHQSQQLEIYRVQHGFLPKPAIAQNQF